MVNLLEWVTTGCHGDKGGMQPSHYCLWKHHIVYEWWAMLWPCYGVIYQGLTTELLSLMVVMLEGLGFNLCVAPFLNICVPDLPQGGQGWRMSEVVGVRSEV